MKISIFGALILSSSLAAGVAWSDEKPTFAAPAGWVRPAQVTAVGDIKDGMAVKILLSDQQAKFGADGVSVYEESMLRVQTSQGLAAVGTLSLAWDPTLDHIIVHKLHILRDDQVIDVLAKQSFTVLRRESNLEAATLDGVLTAVIQPEDLRVGDVIDLAYTRIHQDPSLAGRNELYLSLPAVPVDDARQRVIADATQPFHWRATDALKETSPKMFGDGAEVSVSIKNMQTLRSPKFAPARFANVRRLEITDFKSWSDLSAVMAPLYDNAETLKADSPLKAEAARIKAFSADPKVRAAKALTLVQDQIRYVALAMNDGGLVPATADETWSRRFGDCKGKTVLLIALLKELGIDAKPALVNSQSGDGMDQRLPAIENFDHVLVRANIAGQVFWLDGTRTGDVSLEDLTVPALFWALPVQPAKATLERLIPASFNTPQTLSRLSLDASAGIDSPAPAHVEQTFHGDAAVVLNAGLANLSRDQMDTALKSYWGKAYDFIKVKSSDAHYDPQRREERLTMDGTATMRWDKVDDGLARRYEADGALLGFKPDFDRDDGPGADAPFMVSFPLYDQTEETIRLPDGGAGFTLDGGDINQTAAGFNFSRKATLADGVFTIIASTRALQPEFPAAEANTDSRRLKDLTLQDLYVRAPQSYRPTKADLAGLEKSTPDFASDFIDRGIVFLNNGAPDEAANDFRKAISLDPHSALATADLGIAEVRLKRFDDAERDFAKAEALDPRSWVSFQGRGDLAMVRNQYDAANQAFTKALDINPEEFNTRAKRASLYASERKWDQSLADIDVMIKVQPHRAASYNFKAQILLASKRPDQALDQADQALAISPDDASFHSGKAHILLILKKNDQAKEEFERAIALKPSVDDYLAHSALVTGNAAYEDIKAALKLKPDSTMLQQMAFNLAIKQGDDAQAVEGISHYLNDHPNDIGSHLQRGEAYVHLHQLDLAAADFAAVRAKASAIADTMHELCGVEGRVGVQLDQALNDCDTALKLRPIQNTYLEGRALVLMRLNRNKEAILAYDAALRSLPGDPVALYGRGLAKMADGQDGHADLAAALKGDANIEQTYADMGFKPTA